LSLKAGLDLRRMRGGCLAGPGLGRFDIVADEKAHYRRHNENFIPQNRVDLKYAAHSAPLIMAMAGANLDVVSFVLAKPARQREDRVSGFLICRTLNNGCKFISGEGIPTAL
jgi:hypothetical protein